MPDPVTESSPSIHRGAEFELLCNEPWAITPEALRSISEIALNQTSDISALQSRLGRPIVNTRTVTQRENVALMPIVGPVFRYSNWMTDYYGWPAVETLATDFAAAEADPRTTHIVLMMDTPGGIASGIAEFSAMIHNSTKPVIAYVGGNAASAGYWMASAAGEIVIARTGAVGSIGSVLTVFPNRDTGAIEIVSTQSPHKRPDYGTPEGRALAQTFVDKLTSIFIADVANYRGVSEETVLSDFGQGDMRLGADAIAAGMADRESTLEQLIAEINGKPTGVTTMSTNQNPKSVLATEITSEYLAANHADLVASIKSAGATEAKAEVATATAAAATAERERIQAVEAAALPGHEELIAKLKFDGVTSGAEAAAQVIAAEKALRGDELAKLRANSPDPVKHTPAPNTPAAKKDEDPEAPLEERAKATWDADKELRSEFGKFETYHAYRKAEEGGQVKRLAK